MKLYTEDSADNLLKSKLLEIKNRIDSETEAYILNVGENKYIDYLKSEFTLDFPQILTDEVYVDTYEADIQGSLLPREFIVTDPYKSFKRDIVVYYLPYTGNIHLLKFRPNTWTTMAGYEIQLDNSSRSIKLEFINFYNDPEKIKAAYDDAVRHIFASYEHLKNEIGGYNMSLEGYIRAALNSRKQQISKKSDFLASLGVPIKKKENISETFSVPKPKLRDKITIRPVVLDKGFKAEPTLDGDNYQKILKIINDIGKNFERLPSTYSNKEEEDLRDHILMILDPNFEYGSVSGETFNKSGKTDIQLRYDSSVVFIAECKFWGGEKLYFKTIDQLIGYLTWRDSKTSIVIFVRNKDFTNVLETVKDVTKKHPNYIRTQPNGDESWFNYIFSLPTDINKEIKIAIQLYHLP